MAQSAHRRHRRRPDGPRHRAGVRARRPRRHRSPTRSRRTSTASRRASSPTCAISATIRRRSSACVRPPTSPPRCATPTMWSRRCSEDLPLKQKLFGEIEQHVRPRHHPRQQHLGDPDHQDHGGLARPLARARHPLVESALSGAAGRGDRHAVDLAAGDRLDHGAAQGDAGKMPVHVKKDVPGFVGNRLQHALWREAIALVEHGICDAETVDTVIKASFGRRLAVLGPAGERRSRRHRSDARHPQDRAAGYRAAARPVALSRSAGGRAESSASSPARASAAGAPRNRRRCGAKVLQHLKQARE